MIEQDLEFALVSMDEFTAGFSVTCRLCRRNLDAVVKKSDAIERFNRNQYFHICEPDWIEEKQKPLAGALCNVIYENLNDAPGGDPRHLDIGWYSDVNARWVKRSGLAGTVTHWRLIPEMPERAR